MAKQNGDGDFDPAATTGNFQRFVKDNQEPEASPRRPLAPMLIGALAVVGLVVIVGLVVMALM